MGRCSTRARCRGTHPRTASPPAPGRRARLGHLHTRHITKCHLPRDVGFQTSDVAGLLAMLHRPNAPSLWAYDFAFRTPGEPIGRLDNAPVADRSRKILSTLSSEVGEEAPLPHQTRRAAPTVRGSRPRLPPAPRPQPPRRGRFKAVHVRLEDRPGRCDSCLR